jgi:putative tryptophan/tyrosine transport system substrate-binding protein
MNRRGILAAAMAVGLCRALSAEAQPIPARPRIGFIGNADPATLSAVVTAFREALAERGWVEGKNLTIEYRWAEGKADRYPAIAKEFIDLKVDVVVASGSLALSAAQQATRTIPIVIGTLLIDPVAAGFVASLARPGGNITGVASEYDQLITKQVQLLAETVPGLARLAILRHITTRAVTEEAAVAAAQRLRIQTQVITVADVADFENAFRMARETAHAILVLPSPIFPAHRRALTEVAAKYRLPACYEFREYVIDGGLMSYGPSIPDMYRRAAAYVDRILKGAKPGDLPIERPEKFEFIINMRVAKALGLAIAPSLLVRADEVVQ